MTEFYAYCIILPAVRTLIEAFRTSAFLTTVWSERPVFRYAMVEVQVSHLFG
jgi:hypothetical protein